VYVCGQVNHFGSIPTESTQPFIPSWLSLRWGTFTCVEQLVQLCDPIRQATLHSSVMGNSQRESYSYSSTLSTIIIFCCQERVNEVSNN